MAFRVDRMVDATTWLLPTQTAKVHRTPPPPSVGRQVLHHRLVASLRRPRHHTAHGSDDPPEVGSRLTDLDVLRLKGFLRLRRASRRKLGWDLREAAGKHGMHAACSATLGLPEIEQPEPKDLKLNPKPKAPESMWLGDHHAVGRCIRNPTGTTDQLKQPEVILKSQ